MEKKCDLSDFNYEMIVGARKGGLSIWETADLLRCSHTTVSRVYREWCCHRLGCCLGYSHWRVSGLSHYSITTSPTLWFQSPVLCLFKTWFCSQSLPQCYLRCIVAGSLSSSTDWVYCFFLASTQEFLLDLWSCSWLRDYVITYRVSCVV